jgi:hypothetical protein
MEAGVEVITLQVTGRPTVAAVAVALENVVTTDLELDAMQVEVVEV